VRSQRFECAPPSSQEVRSSGAVLAFIIDS
jgi:hypothetical protein